MNEIPAIYPFGIYVRQMPAKCPPNARQMPAKCPPNARQMPAKCPLNSDRSKIPIINIITFTKN
jgi:hypothetical protein